MYTLTIHVAPKGATYIDQVTGAAHPSAAGHMWYSIASPAEILSKGFGPIQNPAFPDISARAPGRSIKDDTASYQGNFAVKTVQITQAQFDTLKAFGDRPQDFKFTSDYRCLANSCIDFTWTGLRLIGINPKGYEGSVLPTQNIPAIQQALTAYEQSGHSRHKKHEQTKVEIGKGEV